MAKLKLDKEKTYKAVFAHDLDPEDVIVQYVTGRGFYSFRSFLSDLGYVCKNVEELTE